MRLLLKIVLYGAAVWAAVKLVDGLRFEGGLVALLLVAVILAAVNTVVKPIVKLFSFPLVILTLGLFLLIVNTLMFWLAIAIAGAFELGISTTGFWATFLGALIVSIVTWIGEGLVDRD